MKMSLQIYAHAWIPEILNISFENCNNGIRNEGRKLFRSSPSNFQFAHFFSSNELFENALS